MIVLGLLTDQMNLFFTLYLLLMIIVARFRPLQTSDVSVYLYLAFSAHPVQLHRLKLSYCEHTNYAGIL